MFTIHLPIDHVAFSTSDRQALEALLHKLGFVFGTTGRDPFVHAFFDRGYLEWVPVDYDQKSNLTDVPGLTAGIRAYYVACSDIDAAHSALVKRGYRVLPAGQFSRYAKHGVNHGTATFRYCIFEKNDIFDPSIGLGCTQQATPQFTFQGHYRHVNDAAAIRSLAFCAGNAEAAFRRLRALSDILEGCLDDVYGVPELQVMNRGEYSGIFGCEAPQGEGPVLASVCVSPADGTYLTTQLEDLHIPHFVRDGRLHADLRKELGAFFIFPLLES